MSSERLPADGASDERSNAIEHDARLYVPESELWKARVKVSGDRDYCYARKPGEDYFHLLLQGELYLESGDEKLCLNCAFRKGVLTTNRLFWQRPSSSEDAPRFP